VSKKVLLFLALLSATAASGATPGFLLGIDYAERFGFDNGPGLAVAADAAGSLYVLLDSQDITGLPATTVLGESTGGPNSFNSYVIKVAPGGDKIAYLTVLGFQAANAIAVDSAGNAYVAGPDFVAKLNPSGTAFVYQITVGANLELQSLAVDRTGRVYLLGANYSGTLQTTPGAFQQTIPNTANYHDFVLRLNAAGTAVEYATYVTGSGNDNPSVIAVDASGAVVIAGTTQSTDYPVTPGAYRTTGDATLGAPFLTRLSPDGSRLLYSTFVGGPDYVRGAAVEPGGSAAVALQSGGLKHFDPTGSLTFSKAGLSSPAGVAMDSAGNVYLIGEGISTGSPIKNSLLPCGAFETAYLTVFDPGGGLLQSTYLSGSTADSLALGPASTVYIVGSADDAFVPTQQIAGMSTGPRFLMRLSQNTSAQPVQLVCVGNAASYDPGSIAAGEIVSLFGSSLGPAQGTAAQVDPLSGFPNRVANVQVTFNGTPGTLLYVQESQINAIAPWSLALGQTVDICVSYNGVATNCLQRAVVDAAPGVFTMDGLHAAALNQDWTINSADNPAKSGSYVSVFATGLGPLNPPQQDGAIVVPPYPSNALATTLSTTVGGIAFSQFPLPTQYVGPAPYEVAGVSQINFTAGPEAEGGYLFLQSGSSRNSAYFAIYVVGQ